MTASAQEVCFELALLDAWLALYRWENAPEWWHDGIGVLCGPSYNDEYTHEQAMADFFERQA